MSAQAVVKIGPHGGKIIGFHGTTPIYAHDTGHQMDLATPHNSPADLARRAGLSAAVHPAEHDKVHIAWRSANQPAADAWLKAHHPLPPGSRESKTSFGASVTVPRAWAEKGTAAAHVAPPVPPKLAHAPVAPPAAPAPSVAPQGGTTHTFEFHGTTANGNPSRKFWHVTLAGDTVTTTWGKVGTAGQSTTQTLASPALAAQATAKLIGEKTKKGYQRTGSLPAMHIPQPAPAAVASPPKPAAPPAPPRPAAPAVAVAQPAPVAALVPAVIAAAGITAVDKTKLKKSVTNWHDSFGHPVTVNGKPGELVGYELVGPKPQVRSGRLVVRTPGAGPLGGKLVAYDAKDVKPVHVDAHQPWHGDDVKVWDAPAAVASMNATLDGRAPGQGRKTFKDCLGALQKADIPVFAMGGFVRDALQGKASKDIDLGFGADWQQVMKVAQRAGLTTQHPGPGGLVKLGDKDSSLPGVPPLEGKTLNGLNSDREKLDPNAPATSTTTLAAENSYGDFCHGRLWFDSVNNVIVDPTGHGVEDALTHTLRIPVPRSEWDSWAGGSPDKIWRAWKFVARGEKYADQETRDFIVAKAKQYFAPGASQWTEPHNIRARLHLGVLAGETSGNAAGAKLKAFKDAVVADMGRQFWDTHWAPHVPYALKPFV